jgi:uracil-DNA glycosylase
MGAAQATLSQRAARPGLAFVDRECMKCGLCAGRTQVVPAEGGNHPRIFFIGEAPGPDEDMQGRPFVGRAGRILRRSLQRAGWTDAETWITNAVKCFPFEVEGEKRKIRKPSTAEVVACLPHLEREVAALRPAVLVALGKTAAEAVLGRPIPNLGEVRGRLQTARQGLSEVPVWVTWHPSGLHYGHATEDEFVADLAAVRRFIAPSPKPQ